MKCTNMIHYYTPGDNKCECGRSLNFIVLDPTKENAEGLTYWINELSDALGKIQWELTDTNCQACRDISQFANLTRLRKNRAFNKEVI